MDPLKPWVRFPHSGTFSANPVTMTAGLVAMEMYDREAIARLNTLTRRAKQGIRDAIEDTRIEASVTGSGAFFRLHLRATPPTNHRDAYPTDDEAKRREMLLDHLFASGFMMINTCSATLSTPMTEVEIDALVDAVAEGLALVG